MNSHISDIDALQPDDIGGAVAIYGAVAPATALEPAAHRLTSR